MTRYHHNVNGNIPFTPAEEAEYDADADAVAVLVREAVDVKEGDRGTGKATIL